MRLFLFVLLAGVLWGAAMAQVPPPDAAPSTPVDMAELAPFEPSREDAVLEGFVDGVVGAHMRAHGAPAVTVSVVRDGRVVFVKAYGEADVETGMPASGTESMFRIGSVSKTFIWTAVMLLHERGLIDLDEDVNVYLTDVVISDAFDAPVTMKHLMAHRAGFEDAFGVFTVSDASEVGLAEALNEHMPQRVYPPGARTSYSNWGSALAAKIVEDVSGVPYETFLQNEILTPLSMSRTVLHGPALMTDAQRAALAKGYRLSGGALQEAPFMNIGPYAPAGAMSSTAQDMARWMLFHLGGGEHDGVRLLRAETHALMTSRPFRDRAQGADLAHGFQSSVYRGVETFGHGGATAAYYTNMVMAPELGVGVFVSQSAAFDRALVTDLPLLVIDHLLRAPVDRAPVDPAFAGEAFAGTYLNNRRSFSRFEKLFALGAQAKVAAVEEGALVVSGGGETIRFAPLPGAQDTFESRDGRRIVFGRNDDGAVTHFSDDTGVHSFDRVTASSNPLLLNLCLGLAVLFSATTLLGAWRRQAGPPMSQAGAGGLAGAGALTAALGVLVFAAALVWAFVALSTASAEDYVLYPPPAVTAVRLVGLVVLAAALGMLISLWPAWRASGWSIWRKLHHSFFALALGACATMLVFWNIVLAPTS